MGGRKVYHVCTVNGLRIYSRKAPTLEEFLTRDSNDEQTKVPKVDNDTGVSRDTTKVNRLSLGGDK